MLEFTSKKMEKKRQSFIESSLVKEDLTFEIPLRPQSLAEFVGQEEISLRLGVSLGAALQRGEPLGHCFLSGPPGLGKTTLATLIAKGMNSSLVMTSGPLLDRPSDLAGILTNLKRGDVLFVDEIHRIPRAVEEYLYSAMEDFRLDLIIDSGPGSRSVQVKLHPFTLVGATTRAGLLSAPMRSRFPHSFRLDFYKPEILAQILERSARLLKVELPKEAFLEIAKRSRGTPRIANHLLRFVRDTLQMRPELAPLEGVQAALKMLAIDERGLDEMDKKILSVIIDHHGGGPVGLTTLAIAVGEESDTVEELYEPFLILEGLLKRTPRGRMATELAYRHLGRQYNLSNHER